MIIQCENCNKKFVVKDSDIPNEGRAVKCSYCSITWHQMPNSTSVTISKKEKVIQEPKKVTEALSVDKIKASDGKTDKFLGSQWAELMPSGKTGLFAKKNIGKELDKLTGRKRSETVKKKKKKNKEFIINPAAKTDPLPINIDKGKKGQGLGFFGYIFLIIIIGFSIVGMLKTFENDLLNNFPQTEYIFTSLDQQLEFFAETFKNMIVIVKDLTVSY